MAVDLARAEAACEATRVDLPADLLHTSYCASNGTMDMMSRVMKNELGQHRIHIN